MLLRRKKSTAPNPRYKYLLPPLRAFATASTMFRQPPEGLKLVREYPLETSFYPRGLVKVQIYEDPQSRMYVYHVVEPEMTDVEVRLYQEVLNMLFYEPPEVPAGSRREFYKEVVRAIDELVRRLTTVYHSARPEIVRYYVYRETVGYSYIDPLMRDPYIEDISCNGPDQPVYVWHRDYEYMPTTLVIPEEPLDVLVLKLAHMAGKHLSIANPVVDAILPDGHRLAATFRREVTTQGSTFTIRKFREKPITIVELIRWGTINELLAAYFWLMMEHKKNGLIMGVTGAGKTSLLNAIATLIKPTYKVVTIEDTPELRLPLPNWVQLVSREFGTKTEGAVEVTLFDLVKISLRYRPDIIIVGEVRGEEAYVLFQAMATGHGGITTIHAESLWSAVERLTSPPMNIPKNYIPLINFALLIRRVEKGSRIVRRVTNVWEVVSPEDYVEIARWRASTDSFEIRFGESHVIKSIAEMLDCDPSYLLYEEIPRRALFFRWLAKKGIVEYREIAKHVSAFYADPEAKMREVYSDLGEETKTFLSSWSAETR